MFDNLKLNNLHADEVDPALQIWMTSALLKTGTSKSLSKQYLTTIQYFTLKDFKCAYVYHTSENGCQLKDIDNVEGAYDRPANAGATGKTLKDIEDISSIY